MNSEKGEIIMDFLSNFLLNSIYLLGYSLVFIFIGGLIIEIIEKKSMYYLQRAFGYGGILLTGLGTVVHEFSHLVFVILGAMKPTEVKLFRPIQGKIDGVLGYVSYAVPGSNSRGILKIYNKIFLIPIGIAPIIGGTLAILGSLKLCLPSTFQYLINEVKSINVNVEKLSIDMLYNQLNLIKTFLGELCTIENITTFKFWIFIFIVLSVASHMSLSLADIKGCLRGVPYLLLAIILVSLAFMLKGYNSQVIYDGMKVYNGYVVTFLGVSILFSILSLIISILTSTLVNVFKR